MSSTNKARPFRFGVIVATDPGQMPTREAWIDLARKTEDLGYATLLVADHYINEYLPIAPLMLVADATSTLRIGSGVFDNNYRHLPCWPRRRPRWTCSRAGASSWG
jgi:alkanesulfonate monooxygenase SsuD/methylene tetrahydromethanopterin reductase-like flavin-dependent oxidoreductase (luciferase family)